jgi:hypothetical protein
MELNGWASPQMLRRYDASARSARALRLSLWRSFLGASRSPDQRIGARRPVKCLVNARRSYQPVCNPCAEASFHLSLPG